MLNLSPTEQRTLGCLIEKDITTPEYYPLSLNALVNACNQKSSRDPVMELREEDVRSALFELEQLGLVRVLQETRSTKFEHLTYHKLDLRRPEIALIALLLLRGPQTSAELRTRAERMYSFDDNSAVLDVLTRLAAREQPLVVQLARQPGSREARWGHLLGGALDTVSTNTSSNGISPEAHGASGIELERLQALEATVASLQQRVRSLEEQLGLHTEDEPTLSSSTL